MKMGFFLYSEQSYPLYTDIATVKQLQKQCSLKHTCHVYMKIQGTPNYIAQGACAQAYLAFWTGILVRLAFDCNTVL